MLALGPTLIHIFMLNWFSMLSDSALSQKWGALYLEFNIQSKKWPSRYYATFMGRRLILSGSIHILRNYPEAQLTICGIGCWMIFIYVTFSRPFILKSNNFVNIGMELCISVAYTAVGMYKYGLVGKDVITWGIFVVIYLSYALNYGLLLYNLLKVIKNKMQPNRTLEIPTHENEIVHR
jgi:hypothetical protein